VSLFSWSSPIQMLWPVSEPFDFQIFINKDVIILILVGVKFYANQAYDSSLLRSLKENIIPLFWNDLQLMWLTEQNTSVTSPLITTPNSETDVAWATFLHTVYSNGQYPWRFALSWFQQTQSIAQIILPSERSKPKRFFAEHNSFTSHVHKNFIQ